MSLGRRDFILGTVGAAAGANLLEGCDDSNGGGTPKPDAGLTPNFGPDALPVDPVKFAHGVASGDPTTTSVILWTRVSGLTEATMLEWHVATDPELKNRVFGTQVAAAAEFDWTIKVDVSGLTPGTTYYYAFSIPEVSRSAIGRTRTLPTQTEHARIAFTSCANYQNGYFSAYGAIAKRADLDLWIHLGDYIYEYADGKTFPEKSYSDPALHDLRPLEPKNECVSLQDYRTRYGHYRLDKDLQELHRLHPLIIVWDDHEFANNAYVDGAENHSVDGSEGTWVDRKRVAARAFFEWLPIREPLPVRVESADPVPKIFRSFPFGDLFDLTMLDTRMIARAKQAGTDSGFPLADVGDPAVWADPARQLLGTEQEQWFLTELSRSSDRRATWRLIGNQIIFTQTRRSPTGREILFSDFWDGYQESRRRVIQHILTQGITNVVFLTGDIHSSFAMEISEDPFAETPKPPFAVELVGPSVTSLAFENSTSPTPTELMNFLLSANKHVKFGEATRKGYVLVDITRARLQAEWYFLEQFKTPNNYAEVLYRSYVCEKDQARLTASETPSAAKSPAAAPA